MDGRGGMDFNQMILMFGLKDFLQDLAKEVVGPLVGPDGRRLWVVVLLAVGWYVHTKYHPHRVLWSWWGRRGRASVSLNARLSLDLSVDEDNVPKRFLAVLHRINAHLATSTLHAFSVSVQVATTLRGIGSTEEESMTYMLPIKWRKICLARDARGREKVWVRGNITQEEPGRQQQAVVPVMDPWGDLGDMSRMAEQAGPKEKITVEVLCAGSSAELDAVLRAWEREYDDHVRESARRHLSVLRPEIKRRPWCSAPSIAYHEHPLAETRIDDLVLSDDCRRRLQDIVAAVRDPARFKSLGADYQVNILLHGPPGTGKTSMAKAIARDLTRFLLHVRLPAIDSTACLEQIFTRPGGDSAALGADSVVYLLDEFDHALQEMVANSTVTLKEREKEDPGSQWMRNKPNTRRVRAEDAPTVQAVKAILDGALNVPGRVVIATSNTIEKLMQMGEDSSFLRARRMECIYVGLCDQAMFRQFWRRVFGDNHPLEDEVGALPADLVAPAEVSSVLLSCYGKPELALSDLRKIVAAKLEAREAAKDDKAEGGKDQGGKDQGSKAKGGKKGGRKGPRGEDEEGEDDDDDEEEGKKAAKGGTTNVNINLTLHVKSSQDRAAAAEAPAEAAGGRETPDVAKGDDSPRTSVCGGASSSRGSTVHDD